MGGTRSIGRRGFVAGVVAAGLTAAGEAWPADLPPLTDEERRTLRAIPSDPPPDKLSNNQHFLVSDERHPERLRHAVAGLGGVFVGVGPEQSYLYAAWSEARILVLVDFDQMVVDLHAIYGAFLRASDTPRRLIDLWRPDAVYAAKAAIASAEPNAERQRALMALYRRVRTMVHGRLGAIAAKHRTLGVPSFLTDGTHYRWVRHLVRTGRTIAVRGDLTADKTMRGIAEAARKLKEPVRGLYLSNVELYVDYDSGLGDNCRAQPTDAESKILRTVFKSTKDSDRYHYCEQRATHFDAWLETGIEDVDAMIKAADKRIDRSGAAWIIPGPPSPNR